MVTSKVVTKTETDIAVLQIKVENIEEKLGEVKAEIRELKEAIDEHAIESQKSLKEIKDSTLSAYKSISDKVSGLEKWRWMLMGAGVVLGTLGYDTIAKLVK